MQQAEMIPWVWLNILLVALLIPSLGVCGPEVDFTDPPPDYGWSSRENNIFLISFIITIITTLATLNNSISREFTFIKGRMIAKNTGLMFAIIFIGSPVTYVTFGSLHMPIVNGLVWGVPLGAFIAYFIVKFKIERRYWNLIEDRKDGTPFDEGELQRLRSIIYPDRIA